MKFGVSLPNNWGVENPCEVVDVAVLAEQLGYDSVWTAEHMINTGYLAERIGDRPYYHCLCTLAYVAARTSRIELGTSVVVLPFRHPVDLAKFAATLDQLSGGRLILGVGVGGLAEEFAAMNLPFEQRGAISDEALQVIKALWTQPRASHQGAQWNFSEIMLTPKPLQKPHVPLWIGGGSPAARRRTALLGDGWHPTGISVEEFRAGCVAVRDMAKKAGRDPDAITMSMRVNVALPGVKLTTEVERRSVLPADDPDQVVRNVEAFQDAGASHMILAVNTQDTGTLCRTLETLARDVVSRFR